MKVVTLYYDHDLPNPSTDWDGTWTLYSFNRRHINYADPSRFFPNGHPTIGLRRRMNVGLAFPLSYTEHGNCQWFRGGDERSGRRGDYDSDTVRYAGLLVWENPPEDMGSRTLAERQRDADAFLETYTAWANGNGYGFRVEDVGPDGERTEIDSIFGFFGNDLADMALQIRQALQGDPNVEFEGEAAGISSYLNLDPGPYPGIGPWAPREAVVHRLMDPDEAAVWSDYCADHGLDNLTVDYQELERLKRELEGK